MALIEIYVDPSIDAASGAGTIGDPYGDLEYAMATESSGVDGIRFNIKAGTPEYLVAPLDILGDLGAPTQQAPVIIQGYTSAAGDGGRGDLDGGGTINYIHYDLNSDHIHFVDMRMGNVTSVICQLDNFCSLIRCELYGTPVSTAVLVDSYCAVIDCYFHTFSGSAQTIFSAQSQNFIANCHFAGGANVSSALTMVTNNDVVDCLFTTANTSFAGVTYSSYQNTVRGNSFYSSVAGTGAAIYGNGTNSYKSRIYDNVIEGFSGAGGYAVEIVGTAYYQEILSNNFYYNCTAFSTYGDVVFLELNNTETAASPFSSASTGDFRPTTEIQEGALSQVIRGSASSTNLRDAGASQSAGSGSSGGCPALVGPGGLVTPHF